MGACLVNTTSVRRSAAPSRTRSKWLANAAKSAEVRIAFHQNFTSVQTLMVYLLGFVCLDTDFCAIQNDCDRENARCINLVSRHTCQCNAGYQSNDEGRTCFDMNECEITKSPFGHRCQANSQCRNTVGSYECVCDEGFEHVTEFTCRRE